MYVIQHGGGRVDWDVLLFCEGNTAAERQGMQTCYQCFRFITLRSGLGWCCLRIFVLSICNHLWAWYCLADGCCLFLDQGIVNFICWNTLIQQVIYGCKCARVFAKIWRWGRLFGVPVSRKKELFTFSTCPFLQNKVKGFEFLVCYGLDSSNCPWKLGIELAGLVIPCQFVNFTFRNILLFV